MSIAVRIALAKQLRALREGAGRRPVDIVTAGIVVKSTLASIEKAERPIKVAHVMALCQFYGADPETSSRLVQMAQNNEKGWWEDHSHIVDPKFRFFIQWESAADRIFSYHAELLYGLLQTADYHRAIIGTDPFPPSSVDRAIEFRLERQRATLGRTPPLRITAILNEAVLTRNVGSRQVMARLREHLLELTQRPEIELYVLPWNVGAHAAMGGPFQIVSFDDPGLPDLVYLETSQGIRYLEEKDRVQVYRERHARVLRQSLPLEEYLR